MKSIGLLNQTRGLDWVVGFKTNCPLVGPGPIGGVPSVGVFQRDPTRIYIF